MMDISHPKVGLFDMSAAEKKVDETFTTTAPDKVILTGKLTSGALLTYHMEGGAPFPGEPGLKWRIVGDKGEIQITNPVFTMDIMHMGAKIMYLEYGEPKLVHPMQPGQTPPEAVEIEVPKDSMSEMKPPAQNVGRLYEAYADGKTDMYPDWSLGLKRHELMEEMFQRWDGKEPFGPKAEYTEKA